MKFRTGHQRSVTGNNIHVAIDADEDETMVSVKVALDGFPLADDDLEPPTQEYENEFTNAGDAGPLVEHRLVVTAITSDNKTHSATSVWTDPV